MSRFSSADDDISSTLFDLLPVGISILDSEQRIVRFNPALAQILGMTEEGLNKGEYSNRIYLRADGTEMPPDEFPSYKAIHEGLPVPATVIGIKKEDGSVIWTEVYAAPLRQEHTGCVIVTKEIGDRLASMNTLRSSELKYRNLSNQLEAIFDHIPALVFYKDKDNRLIRVNKYLADIYRKDKKDLEGVSLYDLYPEEEARKYHQDDLAVLESGEAHLNFEEHWVMADGSRWLNTSKIPLFNDEGVIQGIIGISMDITERKKSDLLIQELIRRLETEKDKAQQSAMTDGLTCIPNRRYFDETLDKELFRLKRSGSPLALILIDIDHFKRYNDRYGHVAGDDCLKLVAGAIRSNIGRAPDFTARYGGEEFAVVMPDTDIQGAMIVAERLRKSIESLALPHEESITAPHVTISLGVASVYPETIDSPETLVRLADEALYAAKNSGRNRAVIAADTIIPEAGDILDGSSFIRLVWHASHECGNETIDREHRKLFALSNKLLASLVSGSHGNSNLAAFADLFDEVAGHFHDEENILASTGYPALEEHRRIHADLVAQARKLAARQKEGTLSIGELFKFLANDVIAQHMFQEDRKFFPYI